MKRRIYLTLILLFLVSGNVLSEKKIKYQEIDSIIIYFTDLETETFSSIYCEDTNSYTDFKKVFKASNSLNMRALTHKQSFKKLIELINEAEYQQPRTPNIRIKVEFFKKKRIKHTFCLNTRSMFFDGKTIKFSDDIFNEVLRLCEYKKYCPGKPKPRR